MNPQAFALVKDLELALPLYQQAQANYVQVTRRIDRARRCPPKLRSILEAEREQAMGEVLVRVHAVLETIRRHEAALRHVVP